MDPALHKSPAIKNALESEEGSYQKLDNSDDYEHIWDNYIITGKNDDIEIDVNKKKEYPITTPVTTPITPSPLQQSFTNDSYNMARDTSEMSNRRSIHHRESNSTSSSNASMTNLISKNQRKANEAYNNEEILPRSPPVPAHYQFANTRPSPTQVKFTVDQSHPKLNNTSQAPYRGQLVSSSHQGAYSTNNGSPVSPRMRSDRISPGSYDNRVPPPSKQGSYNSNNGAPRVSIHLSSGPRSPNSGPRSPNYERSFSNGGVRPPPNQRPTPRY